MTQNTWTAIIAAIIVVIAALLMWKGWNTRKKTQDGALGTLPTVPTTLGEPILEPLSGVYVGSTTAGHWQDRVVQEPLGFRSAGNLIAYPEGILLNLDGGQIWIPQTDLRAVRTDSRIANKVVPGKGILVFTWTAEGNGDPIDIDTGFRADEKDNYSAWTELKESK